MIKSYLKTRGWSFFPTRTRNMLFHAPFTHIVVFWHIGNVPPMIL